MIIQAYFQSIMLCGPFFYGVLIALVPMGLVALGVGLIKGICNVRNY